MNAHKFKIVAALIALVFVFLILLQKQRLAAIVPNTPPNVILISIDSLRADRMSLYGYPRKTTPVISNWAKDAAVFDNYFSTSYLTPISEASVHTGKYPFVSGVINFQTEVASGTPTLGEILKAHGWDTATFGSSPEFDSFPAGKSLSRGFDVYDVSKPGLNQFNGRGVNPIAKSIPWIKEKANENKPFFLWLNIGSVHWPYGQNEPNHFSDPHYSGFFDRLSERNVWNTFGFVYNLRTYLFDSTIGKIKYDGNIEQKDIDYVGDRYDDGIVRADRQLGELFELLKSLQIDKHTIIILQSEHGEGLGERGYILHYDIHNEQVHTPLIIKAPGIAPERVQDLASGVDVLPTLLDLLKLPVPPVDGESFVPRLTTKVPLLRDEVFLTRTSLWERVIAPARYPQLDGLLEADNVKHFHDTAILTQKWKLIHRLSNEAQEKWSWLNNLTPDRMSFEEYELYDVVADPNEKQNIYLEHEIDPEIVTLREELQAKESTWTNQQDENTTPEEIQPYF